MSDKPAEEQFEANKTTTLSRNFPFNSIDASKYSGAAISVSDSAYNSMVCSPFSPVGLVKSSSKSSSPNYRDTNQVAYDSVSPSSEMHEIDDVFQVSLEQLNSQKVDQKYDIHGHSNFMANAIFRPISSDRDTIRFQCQNTQRSSDVPTRSGMMSHRSISTQTKFSLGPSAMYRPSSAPLQEGIEEELDEINTDQMVNINYRMHRNSTCNCIRSPMPDLIQPAFQSNHQLLASRLSLIADQIDESITSQTSETRNLGRTRRFSTPSIAHLTSGGSLIDLIYSIYNAFDISIPGRRRRRHTTSSN